MAISPGIRRCISGVLRALGEGFRATDAGLPLPGEGARLASIDATLAATLSVAVKTLKRLGAPPELCRDVLDLAAAYSRWRDAHAVHWRGGHGDIGPALRQTEAKTVDAWRALELARLNLVAVVEEETQEPRAPSDVEPGQSQPAPLRACAAVSVVPFPGEDLALIVVLKLMWQRFNQESRCLQERVDGGEEVPMAEINAKWRHDFFALVETICPLAGVPRDKLIDAAKRMTINLGLDGHKDSDGAEYEDLHWVCEPLRALDRDGFTGRWLRHYWASNPESAREAGLPMPPALDPSALANHTQPQRDAATKKPAPVTPPAPTQSCTVADVRLLTGLGNTALHEYAKAAGVTTPGRGQRNFRYPQADVCAILRKIIGSGGDATLRETCRKSLRNLTEITE